MEKNIRRKGSEMLCSYFRTSGKLLVYWFLNSYCQSHLPEGASGIPTLCHLIPSQEQPDTQMALEVTLCAPERIKNSAETSLEVQWLRPHTSTARGRGSIPSWGTKIPHAPWLGQNQTRKQSKKQFWHETSIPARY